MKIKSVTILFIVLLLVVGLACCAANGEEHSVQNSDTDSSQQNSGDDNTASLQQSSENSEESHSAIESVEEQQTEDEPEIILEEPVYMSFEEITELGHIPYFMQPNTVIIYDADGVPTIVDGGELLPEDFEDDEDLLHQIFIRITPNTKIQYGPRGDFQNIYYRIPGTDSYQLDPDVSWALSSSANGESEGTD